MASATRPSCIWTSIRRRPARWAWPRPTSIQRCPRRGVAPTSTTSWTAAGSSVCTCRVTSPTAACPTTSASGMCAAATDRWPRSPVSPAATGHAGRSCSSASMVCRRCRCRAVPPKGAARAKRCRPCRRWWPSSPALRCSGVGCPTRSSCPATRRCGCTRRPSPSSSCAWPRSMRAGRCRWR
ncbi:hypothetical protein D3C71_1297460 [compost metagenome]